LTPAPIGEQREPLLRDMSKTTYTGIDYGVGRTNIDLQAGIRFGVISQHTIGEAWFDEAEPDYGKPHCPKCGKQADEPSEFGETFADGRPDDYTSERHECDDYVCVECKHFFGSESAFGDEPLGYGYDQNGYKLSSCLDTDVMVLKSPFFTYAQFCSPCVPGACNLDSPLDVETFTVTPNDVARGNNIHPGLGVAVSAGDYTLLPDRSNRCYCLGHDWFEDGKAPYPVYSVETGEIVPAPMA
jgi:hypothetical protein